MHRGLRPTPEAVPPCRWVAAGSSSRPSLDSRCTAPPLAPVTAMVSRRMRSSVFSSTMMFASTVDAER